MPRVNFVKKAAKAYPNYGIEKGDSYYWWKFRYGGEVKSKTRPRQSQLTQSDFLSQYYGFSETLEDMTAESIEDLESQLNELAEEMRNLASEQEDKLSNMPDQLQYSSTGELLQERADGMNQWADELDGLDFTFDPEEGLSEEETEEALRARIDELLEEAQGADPGLS